MIFLQHTVLELQTETLKILDERKNSGKGFGSVTEPFTIIKGICSSNLAISLNKYFKQTYN